MALSCRPRLLLADEPTTALDATVQIQVLVLLRRLQRELGMGMVIVTHDLGVAAEIADRVAVMYAGQIVEQGPVRDVLRHPAHPYTQGLLASVIREGGAEIAAIPGAPPDLRRPPPGCAFAPRCPGAIDACLAGIPDERVIGHGAQRALHQGGRAAGRLGRDRGMKPKVAFIGTGGTISSLGAGPLDVQDYGATGNRLHAEEIIAMYPALAEVADVVPIRYNNIVSPGSGSRIGGNW